MYFIIRRQETVVNGPMYLNKRWLGGSVWTKNRKLARKFPERIDAELYNASLPPILRGQIIQEG